MTESQRIKRNETRQRWRKANAEKVREQNRLEKRKARLANPEKFYQQHKRWKELKKQKEKDKSLGYIVQVADIDMPQQPAIDFKCLSEYEILKYFRIIFSEKIKSGIKYSVFKIKHSHKFDEVPFDETDS